MTKILLLLFQVMSSWLKWLNWKLEIHVKLVEINDERIKNYSHIITMYKPEKTEERFMMLVLLLQVVS